MPDVAGVGIHQTKVVKYTASLVKYASQYFNIYTIRSKCRKTDQIYQYKGLKTLKTSIIRQILWYYFLPNSATFDRFGQIQQSSRTDSINIRPILPFKRTISNENDPN